MLEVHSHLIDVLHPSVLLPSIKVPVNISMHDRDRNVLSFSNCQDLVFLSLRYFDTLFSGFVSSTIIDRTKDRLVIETDLLSSSSCRIASSARSSKRYGENGLSDKEDLWERPYPDEKKKGVAKRNAILWWPSRKNQSQIKSGFLFVAPFFFPECKFSFWKIDIFREHRVNKAWKEKFVKRHLTWINWSLKWVKVNLKQLFRKVRRTVQRSLSC